MGTYVNTRFHTQTNMFVSRAKSILITYILIPATARAAIGIWPYNILAVPSVYGYARVVLKGFIFGIWET